MVVDFIMASTFEEVNLEENSCIVPPCGHILTLESMDGHMSMSDFYTMDAEGSIEGLKNNAEPFSASEMKSCPTCRSPLRSLNRYSRIIRRAMIDEATKKFIVWANRGFIPLVKRMEEIEADLRGTTGGIQATAHSVLLEMASSESLQVNGTRDQQFRHISNLLRKETRYKAIIKLRREIESFLQQVSENEQPFGRIFDLVEDARRYRGINVDLHSKVDILQVRNRLLTTALLIRCDYTMLLTLLNDLKGEKIVNSTGFQVDLSVNREDCNQLIAESGSRNQPSNEIEGHLYWARFFTFERTFAPTPESAEITELLNEARNHLQLAHELCDKFPGQTKGMRQEIAEMEKSLRDSTFYMPVSNEEKAAVYAAMAQDFRGTGHWYYCENGHPFTVGECGMPMQTSTCPQCESPVGGSGHVPVAGVRRAMELDDEFAGLGV